MINYHAQYITDFNIIYENPEDIKLYSIATLHTSPVKKSYTISSNENYKFENKPQQIQFHKQHVQIKDKLHIIKNSKKYFEDSNVKENIEKLPEYKEMFDNVIGELKSQAIKFRIAQNTADFSITGFNIFLKKNPVIPKNDLLETLNIPQDHDK